MENLYESVRPSSTPFSKRLCEEKGDILQQSWYHGSIDRQVTEDLLKKNGDFLVRYSVQNKSFVLSCRWNGLHLHFVVNQISERNEVTGIQKIYYQFESHKSDSPVQLVHSHFYGKIPISEKSGAIISRPVPNSNKRDEFSSDCTSSRQHFDVPMQRRDSQPLLCAPSKSRGAYHHSRSGSEPVEQDVSKLPAAKLKRSVLSSSHSKLSSTQQRVEKDQAPPKPSRIPTVKLKKDEPRPKVKIRNLELYADDGKDYSDYAQVKAWTSENTRPPPLLLRASSTSTTSQDSGFAVDAKYAAVEPEYDIVAEPITPKPVSLLLPQVRDVPSKYDASHFLSQVLTPQNKPLESSAVSSIRSLLLECSAHSLALHLTLLDLDLLRVLTNHDLGAGVFSGLELLTLPQGEQLRRDTLERFSPHIFFKHAFSICYLVSDKYL